MRGSGHSLHGSEANRSGGKFLFSATIKGRSPRALRSRVRGLVLEKSSQQMAAHWGGRPGGSGCSGHRASPRHHLSVEGQGPKRMARTAGDVRSCLMTLFSAGCTCFNWSEVMPRPDTSSSVSTGHRFDPWLQN